MNNISFDLGLLAVFNANPCSKDLTSDSKQNFMLLFHELLKLKQKAETDFQALSEDQQIHDFQASKFEVKLPEKITVFPRHKKIPPLSKLKTKWETFAATKGIAKKKRSRMVFDESTGDWVPRWGARSVKKNKEKQSWAIELKPEQRNDSDPFKEKGLQKELKNEREKLKKIKNIDRKMGGNFICFYVKSLN